MNDRHRIVAALTACRTRLCAAGLAGLALVPQLWAVIPEGNLLVNGSGASPTTTGWTVLASGGDGWGHSATGGYDSTPGFFITSYAQCRRSQTIDLLATGATEAELDAAPRILVSEAISSYVQGATDTYYIRVELRGATGNVIAAWDSGTQGAPLPAPASWTEVSHEFSNYGPGVRSIYFEDGGVDAGYWAGHYGTYHDAAIVLFFPDADGDGLPDQWEEANGTDPDVADDQDDLDSDGLTNLQEYELGTRADLVDTDGDGLWDIVEDMLGSWAGEDYTGTNPLNPDTDGDGLADGTENPDLPFVDASQPGTDPNLPDSDFDGMPDLAEIVNGADPTDPGSYPTFTYGNLLVEDFDGTSVNSTYAFTQSAGSFAPAVLASGVAPQANAVRLTQAGVGSSSTSVAWDAIPANAASVRLTFDFRMSADAGSEAADGFGIGFFKTATHGTTGARNPGYSPTVEINWENPDTGPGFPDAVTFGFDIYGGITDGNTIRLTGPAQATPLLAAAVPPFQLNAGVFHRVTITAVSNGPGSAVFSLQLAQDVNGAGTIHELISNVVVPGFDLTADSFRLIAGGRTGGSTVTTELDNLTLATTSVLPPVPVVRSAVIDRSVNPPELVITWSSVAGAAYIVEGSENLLAPWTQVQDTVIATDAASILRVPLPPGSPHKKFFRVKLAP